MTLYTISTDTLKVTVKSKGAVITQIQFLNNGIWVDTLMDYDDISVYDTQDPYFLNCVVGPHAGRIKNGTYRLNGDVIQLERNEKGNHHHGGTHSFKKIDFEAAVFPNRIELTHFDIYHNIRLRIVISVMGSTLSIQYEAVPETPQVINMTHHLYFNLSDEKTIKNHTLMVKAPYVHAVDASGAATDEKIKVTGTPFDFTEAVKLGDRMEMHHPQFEFTRNIDHPFYTKKTPLILESDVSRCGVKIQSTSDFTVLYTANFFDGAVSFKNRGPSQQYEAIAIESQDLPNGVNIPNTKYQIYSKTHPYTQTTTFSFYTL